MEPINIFSNAPIDIPIYIIDNQHRLYIGTITKINGLLYRGKCFSGDPEWFYRNAFISWAYGEWVKEQMSNMKYWDTGVTKFAWGNPDNDEREQLIEDGYIFVCRNFYPYEIKNELWIRGLKAERYAE